MPFRLRTKLGPLVALIAAGMAGSGFAAVTVSPTTPTQAVAVSGSNVDSVRQRLDQLGKSLQYFETKNLISNRGPLRVGLGPMYSGEGLYDQIWPESLESEHTHMLAVLRSLGGERAALGALLKDADPKLRTLALGALFLREDAHDLPLIVSCVPDGAITLPIFDRREPSGNSREFVVTPRPQTVGEVATAMLRSYLDAASISLPVTRNAAGAIEARPADTLKVFDQYWAERGQRARSASWWLVKLWRATRQTTPFQPQYQQDIERVLAEINALPPVERGWVLLYGSEGVAHDSGTKLLPDDTLVAALKNVGPDALVQFLQHKSSLEDPDLRFDDTPGDARNRVFLPLAEFILLHASDLLRPQDADAVLAGADGALPTWQGNSRKWSAAAFRLINQQSAAQVTEAVRTALVRHPVGTVEGRRAQGEIMAALWEVRGSAEQATLVDWFYQVLPHSLSDDGPDDFLRGVAESRRTDTKELLAALVADPRFDNCGTLLLAQLLALASVDLPVPLADPQELNRLKLRRNPPSLFALNGWRDLLRRHYGFSEHPVTVLSPQTVLTVPAWSTPLSHPPLALICSEDGRWLALMNQRGAGLEIREGSTGRLTGTLSKNNPEPVAIAFAEAGRRLTHFDVSNGIYDWDTATRKKTERGQLDQFVWEASAHEFGTYAFDGDGSRLGAIGYKFVACYDAPSRHLLWQQADPEFGVESRLALSPDGRLLAASINAGGMVQLFNAANGTPLQQLDSFGGAVRSLAFSPDGKILATAVAEDGVRLWDTPTGRPLRTLPYPVLAAPGTLAFSPDGTSLAVIALSSEGPAASSRIGVFRVRTGELRWEMSANLGARTVGNPAARLALAFSPDGKKLYTAGQQLAVWSLE